MKNRREFMKDLTAASGGLGLLNSEYGLSEQDSDDHEEVTEQDKQVLREFEEMFERLGALNEDLSSVEREENRTVYTLGRDTVNHDLYATSFSNFDNQLVHTNDIEAELKNVAMDVASKGDSLVAEGDLPNDEILVYAGITGRNNSFLPMALSFSEEENSRSEYQSEGALQELKGQTGDAIEELLPRQEQALRYLGGFDDAYQNKVVITENLDGVDNNYLEPGEFELGDEYAELVNIQTNNGRHEAWISTDQESDDFQNTEVGYRFDVGDYELRVLHADPEAGYIEAEVLEGDYDSIDNTPFPQVEEPF